jgi:hypothetical protein
MSDASKEVILLAIWKLQNIDSSQAEYRHVQGDLSVCAKLNV